MGRKERKMKEGMREVKEITETFQVTFLFVLQIASFIQSFWTIEQRRWEIKSDKTINWSTISEIERCYGSILNLQHFNHDLGAQKV